MFQTGQDFRSEQEMEEYILSLFPDLNRIEDEKIRRKVVQVWKVLIERSGGTKPEDLLHPLSEYSPLKKTLVEHLNDVTEMSIEIAKFAEKAFNIRVKMDYLIAAANLSDAGALLEGGWHRKSKKVGENETGEVGKLMAHAFISSHEALNAGLPLEVAHAISAHATESSRPPKTVEAIICRYADMIVDDVLAVHLKRKPLLTSKMSFFEPHFFEKTE